MLLTWQPVWPQPKLCFHFFCSAGKEQQSLELLVPWLFWALLCARDLAETKKAITVLEIARERIKKKLESITMSLYKYTHAFNTVCSVHSYTKKM